MFDELEDIPDEDILKILEFNPQNTNPEVINGKNITSIVLPKHSESKLTPNIDDKAWVIEFNENELKPLQEWCQDNWQRFSKNIFGNGSRGDLPALNLPSDILTETTINQTHPLINLHVRILQFIANLLGCNITTNASSNNYFVCNLYSWDPAAKNTNAFFTAKDNPAAGFHHDNDKTKDSFKFTVAIYICNDRYNGPHDGKRFLFPSEHYRNNQEDIYISPEPHKVKAVIFPSYTFHGTEEWQLEKYKKAIQTIIKAYRAYKSRQKADNNNQGIKPEEKPPIPADPKTALPWRASFVWRGDASKDGHNGEEVANLLNIQLNSFTT